MALAFSAQQHRSPAPGQAQAPPPQRQPCFIPNPLPPTGFAIRRNYAEGNSVPLTLSMRPHMLKIMPSRFM